jgi:hypothetical protein
MKIMKLNKQRFNNKDELLKAVRGKVIYIYVHPLFIHVSNESFNDFVNKAPTLFYGIYSCAIKGIIYIKFKM